MLKPVAIRLSLTVCAAAFAALPIASAHAQAGGVRPVFHNNPPPKVNPKNTTTMPVLRSTTQTPVRPPAVNISERPHLSSALQYLSRAGTVMRETSDGASTAVGLLRSALNEINASLPNEGFQGRRLKAINCTTAAIKALSQQTPDPKAMQYTSLAIGHIQFCLQAQLK